MRDFTLAEIKAICDAATLPLGVPFIDSRLDEYAIKYNGNYPYYSAFRDLVKALKPSVVLEVGTWEGTSAAAFAAGDPDCQVITIDHHSDPGDDFNQKRTLEAHKEYPNISYFQGCSTELVLAEKPGSNFVLPDILEFLNGRTIDVTYIDGWHMANMAKADFDTYLPYMSPNGLVIWDDIYGGDCATIGGMLDLWNSLPYEKWLCSSLHGGYPQGFMKLGGK